MKRKRLILIGTLVGILFILIASFYLFAGKLLPHLINLEAIKAKIEEGIQNSTGIRTEIEEISIDFTLFNGIEVQFENNVLYDPEDVQVVESGQVVVNIRYLPLLRGKTSLSRIAFNNITVYIGERSFLFRLRRPEAPSQRVFLEDTRIEFNNYRILVDRYFDGTNQYLLDGADLVLEHFNADVPIQLHGAGTGFFGLESPDQRLGRFELSAQASQEVTKKRRLDWQDVQRFNLQLQDVTLSTLGNILQTYGLPVDATGHVGRIMVEYRSEKLPRTLEIRGYTDTPTQIEFAGYDFEFDPGTLAFQTRLVDFDPLQQKSRLENLVLQLASRNFRALVRGNVFLTAPFSQSRLDLRIVTSWLPVNALRFIPQIPPAYQQLLSLTTGDYATSLQLRGPLKQPEITGKVHIKEITVRSVRNRQRQLIQGLSATLNLVSPDVYLLERLRGQVAQSPVRANILLNLRENRVNGNFSAPGINLAQLRELVRQWLPGFEALQRFSLTGQASADLSARGPLGNPALFGRLQLSGVSVSLARPAVDRLVQNITGQLVFQNRLVRIQRIRGRVNGNRLLLDGLYRRDTQQFDLLVQSPVLNLAEARQTALALAQTFNVTVPVLPRLMLAGQAGLNLRIFGTPAQSQWVGRIRLADASIRDRVTDLGLFNIYALLDFQGDRLVVQQLAGRFEETPVTAQGVIPQTGAFQLAIQSQGVSLAGAQRSLVNLFMALGRPQPINLLRQIRISGTGDLEIALFGPLEFLRFEGLANLVNASITAPQLPVTLSRITARVSFTQNRLGIQNLQAQLNNIPLLARGIIYDNFQRIALEVTAQNADLAQAEQLIAQFRPGLVEPITLQGTADIRLNLTGPVRNPLITGLLNLEGVQLTYLPENLTFQNLVGQLVLTPEQLVLQNIQGLVEQIPVMAAGVVDRTLDQYRIAVESRNINIQRLEPLLQRFAPDIAAQLAQAGIRQGLADLSVILSPQLPTGLAGMVQLREVVAVPVALGVPVEIPQIRVSLADTGVTIPRTVIRVAGIPLVIEGALADADYRFQVRSDIIPVAFVRDNQALLERILKVELPTLYVAHGALQVSGLIQPAVTRAVITFLDAGASMKELKYPIYNVSGTVSLTVQDGITSLGAEALSFRYANSPVHVATYVENLKDIRIRSDGRLSPLLLNEILGTLDTRMPVHGTVPFETRISGTLGQLAGQGTGNDLVLQATATIPALFAPPPQERLVGKTQLPAEVSIVRANAHLVEDNLMIPQLRVRFAEDNGLTLHGRVENVFDPQRLDAYLRIKTDPVADLSTLARQIGILQPGTLGGTIGTDLMVVLDNARPWLEGIINLNNIQSSYLEVEHLSGKFQFRGNEGFLDVTRFAIPGVDVAFTAQLADLSRYPLPVTNFTLVGQQFVVSQFTEWINTVIRDRIRNQLLANILPLPRPGGPRLPFEIQSGTITLDEAIVSNVILEDYRSRIRVHSSTAFELTDASAKTAGGRVSGYFAMNPAANNLMTASLVIDRMSANALTRIFLDVTNVIFGDLSGTLRFVTEGRTADERIANANGYANLRIENGRLPQIARIENMLLVASTFAGGLIDLDLGNLLWIATRYDTNYFATLTGTFNIVNGTIFTNNLFIDGDNLDFRVQGTIRMINGFANLLVRGQVDEELGGLLESLDDTILGPVVRLFWPVRQALRIAQGEVLLQSVAGVSGVFTALSLARLFRAVPVLGTIVSHIPIIGYIPGLGVPGDGDGLAFTVRIIGPVNDPGSIQDFQWVR